MDVVDEDGNLFGVVNLVDALVVLFLLVTVAVGTAITTNVFTTVDTGPEPGGRYATVVVTGEPVDVADHVAVGDRIELSGGATGNVTDVALSITSDDPQSPSVSRLDGSAWLAIRVRVGQNVRLRAGEVVRVQGESYELIGAAREINEPTPDLETHSISLSIGVAHEAPVKGLTPGTGLSVGTHQYGTIDSISRAGRSAGNRSAVIAVTVTTVRLGETLYLGGKPVRIGSTYEFWTDRVRFSGTAVAVRDRPGTSNVSSGTSSDVETQRSSTRDILPVQRVRRS